MNYPRLITMILLLVLPVAAVNLYSQAVKENKKDAITESRSTLPEKKTFPLEEDPFSDESNFRLGFLIGINKPMGDLGKALGMGYGGLITGSMNLPFKLGQSTKTAARIDTGYYTLPGGGNDFTGTVSIIPFIASIELFFFTAGGTRLFFGLGGGFTYAMLSGDGGKTRVPDNSSLDGTAAFNAGIGLNFKSMPKVEFQLNYTFLLVFESVMGQFSTVSLGAVYKINTRSEKVEDRKPAVKDTAPDKKDARGSTGK